MSGAPVPAVLAALSAVLGTAAFAIASRVPVPAGAGPMPASTHRVRGALARLGRSRPGRALPRTRLTALADAAGSEWHADELAGAKLAAIVAAVVLSIPVPLLALPLALAAWRGPELVLARRIRRREAEAAREVPLFLDLLAVACSAGLAPQLAVRLAAEPLRGPLAEALGSAIRRTDLGRRWRDEIDGLAVGLGLTDLRRAAALLGRSETLGSSLADEVSRLAADVRDERRARAAERARTAPVKMLFPLVFLILPAFLLLTVVPVLLSTVRSIG